MAKPIRGIYLVGDTIETLEQGTTERNPVRVFWDSDVAIRQNMMIWVENEDGELKPKYQIPADGEEGFPLSYNKKDKNGIFLNAGDRCRLQFRADNQFTEIFEIPTKGKK